MKKVEVEPIEFINEELIKRVKDGGLACNYIDSRDLRKTLYAVRIYESDELEDFYDFAVYDDRSSAEFCRKGIISGKIRPKGLF